MIRFLITLSVLSICVGIVPAQCVHVEEFDTSVTLLHWQGDRDAFMMNQEGLRSNSDVPNDTFGLYFTCDQSQPDARIRYRFDQNYETSSLNYVDILVASQDTLVLRFGGSHDAMTFFRFSNGLMDEIQELGTGLTGKEMIDLELGLFNDKLFANCWFRDLDTVIVSDSIWFVVDANTTTGFIVRQSSSSFFGKTVIREFEYTHYQVDHSPPMLVGCAIDGKSLTLSFTEAIVHKDQCAISVNSSEPVEISWSSDTSLIATMPQKLSGTNQIEMLLCDRYSNCRFIDTTVSYSPPPPVSQYDVLITELMADPEPVVQLPLGEYIELFNRSDSVINLGNWTISDPGKTVVLTDCMLSPGEYMILCDSKHHLDFQSFGKCCPVYGLPSLNNSGDSIWLSDPDGSIIHLVSYEISDFENSWKSGGGWSLELQDRQHPCSQNNWTWSVSNLGGTPGFVNSTDTILNDFQSPGLIRTTINRDQRIEMVFDEPIELPVNISFSEQWISYYWIEGSSFLIQAKGLIIDKPYQLKLHSISDCRGNTISDTSIQIGLAGELTKGELVLNEILCNSDFSGGNFVEIVNVGTGIEDLSTILFGTIEDGLPIELNELSVVPLLIYPGEVVAFTKKPSSLKERYAKCKSQRIEQARDFPSLSSSETIAITNRSGEILDSMTYSKSMHFDFLLDDEGISLERIDPRSNLPGNWTSGSAVTRGASPGCPNSVSAGVLVTRMKPVPDPFSPDYDGYNDRTEVKLNWTDKRISCYFNVLDMNGVEVASIMNGETIQGNEILRWDGRTRYGDIAPDGIYFLSVRGFSEEKQYRDVLPVTLWRSN